MTLHLRLFREDAAAPDPVLTVRELIALYLRHCAADSVHTPQARSDREFVFRLFVEHYGDWDVATMKPFHLTDFIEGHPAWKSTATKRGKANYVRAAFNWAANQERIDRNPFARVRYAEAERRPDMPDNTLERIEAIANKSFEHALRFLRLTGCRLSELCQAQWPDMDLERGIWTISNHKSRKRTGKPKVVALVAEAVELLRCIAATRAEGIAAKPAAKMVNAVVPADTGHVFLNTCGRPWTRRNLALSLQRIKERGGISEPATLHGIRHRTASAAIEAGAPLKAVAEQLGHQTTAITERYYYHRSDAMLDAMKDAVERGLPKK